MVVVVVVCRWKATSTLPYNTSKTVWPVKQLESCFLPDFSLRVTFSEHNYNILKEIASGAFGKVYKVQQKDTEEIFALKVLSKSKVSLFLVYLKKLMG